jgi:predicted esterase
MTEPAEPVVSVHGARDMSPEAREAVEALIAVAKRQMTEDPPDHNDGPSVREAAADDRAYWTAKYAREEA